MWRGLVLVAAVIALGFVVLALTPSAPAAPTPPAQSAADVGIGPQDYAAAVWYVEYRSTTKQKWSVYSGPHAVKKHAEAVAAELRKRGYHSRIVKG